MVNLQPQLTTDRHAPVLLDEEDERERVLLVVVGDGAGDGAGGSAGDRHSNGMLTYAMNVASVREVIGARSVTRVPGTPKVMAGLVNVRGMVVTVLDLATCLGLSKGTRTGALTESVTPPTDASARTETAPRAQTRGSIVLLEHSGRLVGLAVDSVRDVRPLDDVGLGDAENAFSDEAVFVEGLASAGGELVTLLDVAALLARHMISSGET